MHRNSVRLGTLLLVCVGLAGFVLGAPEQPPQPSADQIIEQAKQAAGSPQEQVLALVRLAWGTPGTHPSVRAAARRELVETGEPAISGLRTGMAEVPTLYDADLVATMLETQLQITSGVAFDLIPALYEAVWFGSAEARRLAIPALAAQGFVPAVLPFIDTAYEHPQLTEVVIAGLVQLGDDRARFFLDEVLRSGTLAQRHQAATGLAAIRGRCADVLREASRSGDVQVRSIAIQALLPVTGLDDLTGLHEYLSLHPQDDAELLERVRVRALQLESLLEQQQAGDFEP